MGCGASKDPKIEVYDHKTHQHGSIKSMYRQSDSSYGQNKVDDSKSNFLF
jgi:hypothetical protein